MFKDKKIVVIGGSIAGCLMGVLLQRLGANVIVLERSSEQIRNEDSGINLPQQLLQQCIDLHLFDENIPFLKVSKRSFTIKSPILYELLHPFWEQYLDLVTLNWSHVYINLRKRIKPTHYFTHAEVQHVHPIGDSYLVETASGITHQANWIIAADGMDSTVRTLFQPKTQIQYSGYIAWHGVLEIPLSLAQTLFNQHMPYYVFPNGYLFLYLIPAADYKTTSRTLLNWTLYETSPATSLTHLLVDKNGTSHTRALPRGGLTEKHLERLYHLAKNVLPSAIAELVCQTPKPFLQVVWDYAFPLETTHGISYIGDAAATLRPHTGLGVAKALTEGIALLRLIQHNPTKDLFILIARWEKIKQLIASKEISKAISLGNAMVTCPPEWLHMDQITTTLWWKTLMEDKNWYAIAQPVSFVRNHSIFNLTEATPEQTGTAQLSKL
jgi:2-polyprenyl-6-methoxyphenol hydroxylase-like FAD-dependent oxidoreductase